MTLPPEMIQHIISYAEEEVLVLRQVNSVFRTFALRIIDGMKSNRHYDTELQTFFTDKGLPVLRRLTRNLPPPVDPLPLSLSELKHPPVGTLFISKGIKWNDHVCLTATKDGHLELLKWLIAVGYPYDPSTYFVIAVGYEHYEMASWLKEKYPIYTIRH